MKERKKGSQNLGATIKKLLSKNKTNKIYGREMALSVKQKSLKRTMRSVSLSVLCQCAARVTYLWKESWRKLAFIAYQRTRNLWCWNSGSRMAPIQIWPESLSKWRTLSKFLRFASRHNPIIPKWYTNRAYLIDLFLFFLFPSVFRKLQICSFNNVMQ